MNPGKHPKYEVIKTETGEALVIPLPDGSLVYLSESKQEGFLEGVKADLENSPVGFEELSLDWHLNPQVRDTIISSLS